ncbi:MAG: GNAT family N-acetyltransferase [Janthinobacterium lividum]
MIKNKFCLALIGLLFLNLHTGQASLDKDEVSDIENRLTQVSLSKDNIQTDKTNIDFNEKEAYVLMIKGSLQLESISDKDLKDFQALWSNPETMKWIGKGTIKSEEQSAKEFTAFKNCWKRSFDLNILSFNNLFTIKVKEPEEEGFKFIGYVNLFTHRDEGWNIIDAGCIELGLGISPEYQGKGQGRQAIQMIIKDYIPYLNAHNKFSVVGQPIASVEATCKPDNVYVNKALREECGDPTYLAETSYGSPRNFYKLVLTTQELKTKD